MTYTKKMHEAARRETAGKHNIVTDLLDEIEHLQNKKYGYVHQDDDGHWYLVPEEYAKLFIKQLDDITCTKDCDKKDDLISEFISNFDEYRLSGGVESLKIMMEEK